jgi:hypothetical protein
MDIAKEREILGLKKELESSESSYYQERSSLIDSKAPELINKAKNTVLDYIENQGFTVTDKENENIKADLNGELIINIKHTPKSLSVNMPNGENYYITVEIRENTQNSWMASGSTSMDRDISLIKQKINTYKRQLDNLFENLIFEYQLSSEHYNDLSKTIEYKKKNHTDFSKLLEVMFT